MFTPRLCSTARAALSGPVHGQIPLMVRLKAHPVFRCSSCNPRQAALLPGLRERNATVASDSEIGPGFAFGVWGYVDTPETEKRMGDDLDSKTGAICWDFEGVIARC
jgi:hypothetical protein